MTIAGCGGIAGVVHPTVEDQLDKSPVVTLPVDDPLDLDEPDDPLCEPADQDGKDEPEPACEPESEPEKEPEPSGSRSALSLRGDPTFDPNVLSPEQRITYDAIKRLIASPPAGSYNPYVMASRDDLWWMGHYLQTHTQAVLIAFRITGDLSFVDHIDELAESARAQLADAWRGTQDGTNGTTDGYLNWVLRTCTNTDNAGKDTRLDYDMKAHATVAHWAYVLHANRDLTSPKGYDYGAHADFWRDYLVNHFEAKMRSRHGSTDGRFPILDWPPMIAAYSDWAKWHYYMGLLTGDASYTAEASRMSGVILGQLHTVSTPQGGAYVWWRSNPDHYAGSYGAYLSPTTYADFVFGNAVEFHLEGFHFWADPAHMQRFALTITQFIMDKPDPIHNGMAADVGGERSRAGIPSMPGFTRIAPFHFATMNLALLAAWDPTTTLPSLAAAMHTHNASLTVDTSRILAGMMLNTHLHSDPSATTWAGRH